MPANAKITGRKRLLNYRGELMDYINKTSAEWFEIKPEIAILPIGSFEQHGPHLPLNTDNIQVEAKAERVAKELNAYLLPVQPITTCYEHHGKRGSVHYSSDVFGKILIGLVEKLYKQGFRKIVIMVGHGGIFITEPILRHLNYIYKDLHVITSDFHAQFDYENMDHAGECETSWILYHRPDLVHMENAVDFTPESPRYYLQYGSFFTHTPTGVWGKASLGTAEKGEILFEKCVAGALKEIKEAFAFMEKTDYLGNALGGISCSQAN